jgi:hypothetical protein
MPIQSFDGQTFVAFLDISGFKQLMRVNEKAWHALDRLYQSGYERLQQFPSVEGLFVSDSGILFVRNGLDLQHRLDNILQVLRLINRDMLESGYMLTTSVAYGDFKFQERIEFPGIGKSPIYGNAYVQSYADNSSGHPAIEPGYCRLVLKSIPFQFTSNAPSINQPASFRFMRQRAGDRSHVYFYWNLDDPSHIDNFERDYTDAYQLKFEGMLKAFRDNLRPLTSRSS